MTDNGWHLAEAPRARRIRDRARMRARALRHLSNDYLAPHGGTFRWTDDDGRARCGLPDWEAVWAFRRRCASRRAENAAACSCPACGNPRRHLGERTWQEIRCAAAGADDLAENGLA
jgi:hypothetical protein